MHTTRRYRAGLVVAALTAGLLTAGPGLLGLTVANATVPDTGSFVFGSDASGVLGDGTTTGSVNAPEQLTLATGVYATTTSMSATSAAAVGSDFKLYTWGANDFGQLGDGSLAPHPLPEQIALPDSSAVQQVSVAPDHTLVLLGDGAVYAFGAGTVGQLGDGTGANSKTPVLVALPATPVTTKIAATEGGGSALTADGTIYSWGHNTYGEVGDGSTAMRLAPVPVTVPGGLGASDIAAGLHHVVVAVYGTSAYAWGDNTYGQLGTGQDATTLSLSDTPVAVDTGTHSPVLVGAGANSSFAIVDDDRTALAWGDNHFGQLGVGQDGTTLPQTDVALPVDAPGYGLSEVAGGANHTLFLSGFGKVLVAGDNTDGQLGTGDNTPHSTPVVITLPTTSVGWDVGAGAAALASSVHYLPPVPPSYPHLQIQPAADGSNGWWVSPVELSFYNGGGASIVDHCALSPATPPVTYADLPITDCDPYRRITFTADGVYSFYAMGLTGYGTTSDMQSVFWKIDATKPVLAPTLSSTLIVVGQSVTANPHATDATSGVATSGCDPVDTSTAGTFTIHCTATDNAGNTQTAPLTYTVTQPMTSGPLLMPASGSKWQGGQTVPVKVQVLSRSTGRPISSTVAAQLARECDVTFSASGAQTVTPKCMTYDASSNTFTYIWKLAKKPTGSETITISVLTPGAPTPDRRSTSIKIT